MMNDWFVKLKCVNWLRLTHTQQGFTKKKQGVRSLSGLNLITLIHKLVIQFGVKNTFSIN